MKKVLVVEDNQNNLKLITYVLEKAGYQVVSTSLGVEGVKLAKKENPFFIILDIDLPDSNGLEVAKEIKMNPLCQHVPVIAITSFAMKGDRERILDSGVDGYFEKPIDPLTIIKDIHKLLRIE